MSNRLISMFCVAFACACAAAFADSSINSTNRWAWSSGFGWLDCRPDSTNGVVVGPYYLSGYMYGGSAGWVKMGSGVPTNGYKFTNLSTNDYGVNHDGEGHLTGFAWSASYGWVSFEWTNNPDASTAPKVNLKSGVLTGYAWGTSIGWISLSNISAYVKTDWMTSGPTGTNGIPDDWEMAMIGSTNILKGGTNDWDSDGMNDYKEYVSGTNPTNAADLFEVVTCTISNSTNVVLTWSCVDSRLYKVETNSSLINAAGWAVDNSLGTIAPDASGQKTLTLSFTSATQLFYRVRACLPLAQ